MDACLSLTLSGYRYGDNAGGGADKQADFPIIAAQLAAMPMGWLSSLEYLLSPNNADFIRQLMRMPKA